MDKFSHHKRFLFRHNISKSSKLTRLCAILHENMFITETGRKSYEVTFLSLSRNIIGFWKADNKNLYRYDLSKMRGQLNIFVFGISQNPSITTFQGRIQDFLKGGDLGCGGGAHTSQRVSGAPPLDRAGGGGHNAPQFQGASPVGVWGRVVSPAPPPPQWGPGAEPPENFCKVALRKGNLRASQSPFLALKHFARVVYQFSDRNNWVRPSSSNCRDSIFGPQNFACVAFEVSVSET